MMDCAPSVAPIIKEDKISKDQCPHNVLEIEHI
jgi:hypothetical protein